jgi:hypothetical protein
VRAPTPAAPRQQHASTRQAGVSCSPSAPQGGGGTRAAAQGAPGASPQLAAAPHCAFFLLGRWRRWASAGWLPWLLSEHAGAKGCCDRQTDREFVYAFARG